MVNVSRASDFTRNETGAISTGLASVSRGLQARRARERVKRAEASPDARSGKGWRVRRVRGEGSEGSGGSFERIRGRGKTRLRDLAPLLQRQQDHLSPTTFLTSERAGPAPRCVQTACCALVETM